MRREKTNYIIQSVSHALDVLEQFTGDQDELGVTELSKRLKLHKNNVFRLLATLESRGYIEQNKSNESYRLGIRCLQIGHTFISQMGLLKQAQPIIQGLSDSAGETAFVGVLRKSVVVPLATVEADRPVRLHAKVGDALPLHCTAAGKVHLANIPPAEVLEGYLGQLGSHTEKTITDHAALQDHLRRVGEVGYALELGEHIADVNAIAVPIRDYTRNVVGSLTLAGPAHRVDDARIERELVPLMQQAGRDLSSRLGFGG